MNQLYRLFVLLFFSNCALQTLAQCPSFIHCLSKTDSFCATSVNDAQLWNNPAFLDPVNDLPDLYEAPTDLSMRVTTTCGNASAIQIRCLLYLDLNGDSVQETVVDSDNLPPANTVFKGNALNPGFAGGDPVAFDERPVAADQKWGFGFEKEISGDSVTAHWRWKTELTPATFQTPKLPGGLHRVVWLLQKQGGGTDTCSRAFRVMDCKAPTVTCITGPLGIWLLPTGVVYLWASDFLNYIEDNITPINKLEIAVRKKGTGTGFPIDSLGNPSANVIYSCLDLGYNEVELWSRDKTGNVGFCETSAYIQEGWTHCGGPQIAEFCAFHHCDNQPLTDYLVTLTYSNPVIPTVIHPVLKVSNNGCATVNAPIIPLSPGDIIEPYKNESPLNGVSTYDLVLISKHILGLEPLKTPYHMIAADANRSGSITTYDIVEIRKLILGININFSNNTSWRFVDKAFAFPDIANPFKTVFPEQIIINTPIQPILPYSFVGIKVGDVNCSAASNLFSDEPADRSAAPLVLPDRTLAASETVELPLQLATAGQWLGAQFSLEYDPQVLEIQQVESSTLPGFDAENWAQPHSGILNVSWSGAVPVTTLPNDPLITLRVKALAPVSLRDAFVYNDSRMHPELYDQEAQPVPLRLAFQQPTDVTSEPAIFDPQPNPATSVTTIPIRLLQPEHVGVTVTDLTGRVLHQRTTTLDAGTHLLEIPASAFPQSGVYGWRIQAGNLTKTGKMIRQ